MERFLSRKYSDLAPEKIQPSSDSGKKPKKPYLERIEAIAQKRNSKTGGLSGLERLSKRYIEKHAITRPESSVYKSVEENQQLQQAYDELIAKLSNNLFLSEKKRLINEGHGVSLPDTLDTEQQQKYQETIERRLEEQCQSLQRIVNYVAENPDNRPLWFRYFMLRSVAVMGVFGPEEKKYRGRSDETIAPFIHLNHEAIGFVQKFIEKKFVHDEAAKESIAAIPQLSNREKTEHSSLVFKQRQGGSLTDKEQRRYDELQAKFARLRIATKEQKNLTDTTEATWFAELGLQFDTDKERQASEARFKEALDKLSFSDLYAYAQTEVIRNIEYVTTDGAWVKYDQDSDPGVLEESLQGKGTGWCTAEGSAPGQLRGGDFYVYYAYSSDELLLRDQGEDAAPSLPAIAVRMLNGIVYEVRGTEPDQNVTPLFLDIASAKVQTLPGGEKYAKRASDMKRLTLLVKKDEDQQSFTPDELTFLHQLYTPIEGFGYEDDPRIADLLATRDRRTDLKTIFPKWVEGGESWSEDTELIFTDNLIITAETVLPKSLKFIEGTITIQKGVTTDTAHRLIEAGEGRVVAQNLSQFSGLTADIANRLIEAGEGTAVADNLSKFSGLDHTDIANRLIAAGKGAAVTQNLSKFSGLDHTDIANRLIEAGQGTAVAYYLFQFSGLTADIAHRLIAGGKGAAMARNLSHFSGLDHTDIANRLIEAGEGTAVADNLSNFSGLDHTDIANRLIAAGKGEAVADNLFKFSGLDHTDIANRLIEAGQGTAVANNLSHFSGLTADMAYRLIAGGKGEAVAYYLSKFSGLDHTDIANRLFEEGQGAVVADNLSNFSGLDHTDIANRLIEAGQGTAVAYNLSHFSGLTTDMAYRLIEEGQGAAVAYYPSNFSGLDHTDIAHRLIAAGEGWAVAYNLSQFSGLDHTDIANRLFEEGQGAVVADNLFKFSGLDHTDIANRLIEAGQGTAVANYLSHFSGLTADIKLKLEEMGYGIQVKQLPQSFL